MKRKILILLLTISLFPLYDIAQNGGKYWNSNTLLNSYRPSAPQTSAKVEYIDLDNDGDPDILRTTINGFPVQWIDDDDDMKYGDTEGDTDNDCLMIDRNRDGHYGGYGDLMIDWIDTDNDGKADMQVVVDMPVEGQNGGHYMRVIDTDKDDIFNYIDWNTMELRCWIHEGQSDFFEDYQGKSMLMKVHSTPEVINDLRLNWENPFLFYDPDQDGLTEMAIRLVDTPVDNLNKSGYKTSFTGKIDWASVSVDLDNDNAPGNEFDFDMTINFRGGGFDYMDQIHKFNNMRGLPASDTMFLDPRWRQLTELIYPGHESAWNLIFNRGKWEKVYFTFDEDDDCNRWERVELYEPLNMFKIGTQNGGLDNHCQADAAGDRGEWDLDNSGKGSLYVSKFDGRIHLFGAEWGCWRVDQNASSYQGMGGLYDGYRPDRLQKEPRSFATVKYTDSDRNGFIDRIDYDLDGDTIFEQSVSLPDIGIDDKCEIINTASMSYEDFVRLGNKVSEDMWKRAEDAECVAKREGINLSWYALLMHPKSVRQKYQQGYWLQFYLFNDLVDLYQRQGKMDRISKIYKAYYSGNWQMMD